MASLLDEFGLSPAADKDVLRAVWGGDAPDDASPSLAVSKWLALLPPEISQQINLALNQERPFMPADITPEMMAKPNATIPSMNHIEIIYRCIDFAMKAQDYRMAAALVYVVDRACYRFGRSAALLHVVDDLMRLSPETPIAPQVILRKARVMKDSGDLHNAMRILDAVISRERPWNYQTQAQYENTKAVCVQIKGQILHNLGLWKDAILPLVESVRSFHIVKDDKGISSSLGLLSRCLNKLSKQDYAQLCGHSPDIFVEEHPCYEAYKKGLEAVRLIENLGATLYVAKHQLIADESLLMYTIQQHAVTKERKWFQTILKEMKQSLAGHRTVSFLHSVEAFFEFVRAIFMISLTLTFSPIKQDADLARFLEKLSMELYRFMCVRPSAAGGNGEPSGTLVQNKYSVRLMNGALALLGLPALEGSADIEQTEQDKNWDEADAHSNSASGNGDASTSSLPSQGSTGPSYSGEKPDAGSSQPSGPVPVSSSVPSAAGQNIKGEATSLSEMAPVLANVQDKAATFPAVSASKLRKENSPALNQKPRQKFVGLPVSKEDLQSATCPAALADIDEDDAGGDWEIVEQGGVESLLPSAETIASISASKKSSKENSSATVDLSATTKSTSSATEATSSSELSGKNVPADSYGKSSSGSSSSFVVIPSGSSSSQNDVSGQKSSNTGSSGDSATVDLSATTKSTSSSTSEAAEVARDVSSPLIDLSSSEVCSLLADLQLGDSVETSDSGEFLASWTPSDDKSVHRAVLWTYNPVTGQWSAQTTLAHLGPKLQTDKEGKFRDAFHVNFLHQDEPLGRYVGKRYRRQRKPEVYMQDVVCQMLAGFYVTRFSQALQHCPLDILQVQFLSAAHLQLCDANGEVVDWINVEPFLHGSFLKLTNNLKFVSQKREDRRGVEVATALSHFSYVETGGTLMVVDLQGWIPSDGKGVVYLTDPVFHTQYIKKFSGCDHQEEGMKAFWKKQHPVCNRICQYLGLDKSRPDV